MEQKNKRYSSEEGRYILIQNAKFVNMCNKIIVNKIFLVFCILYPIIFFIARRQSTHKVLSSYHIPYGIFFY